MCTIKYQEVHVEKILLRPSEVSELVGMGKSKVYELIAAGTIPCIRIGKSVRVPAEALRRWIDGLQGEKEPSQNAPKTAHSSEFAQSSHRLSTEI
jgi:excisionase family DNA binding protein